MLAARSDSTTLLPVTTTAADVVAVEVVEGAEGSMTEEDVAVVGAVDVAALAVVEVRAAVVEAAPTVGVLETSKERSRLSLKSAMAMP